MNDRCDPFGSLGRCVLVHRAQHSTRTTGLCPGSAHLRPQWCRKSLWNHHWRHLLHCLWSVPYSLPLLPSHPKESYILFLKKEITEEENCWPSFPLLGDFSGVFSHFRRRILKGSHKAVWGTKIGSKDLRVS